MRGILEFLGIMGLFAGIIAAVSAAFAYVWFLIFGGDFLILFQDAFLRGIVIAIFVITIMVIWDSYKGWQMRRFLRLARNLEARKALARERRQRRLEKEQHQG